MACLADDPLLVTIGKDRPSGLVPDGILAASANHDDLVITHSAILDDDAHLKTCKDRCGVVHADSSVASLAVKNSLRRDPRPTTTIARG